MRRYRTIVIALCLAFAFVAVFAGAAAAIDGKRISVPGYKVSFVLPKGWTQGKTFGGNAIQVYKGSTGANIGLRITPIKGLPARDLTDAELNEISKSTVEGLKTGLPSYKLVKESRMKVAGVKAITIEGTYLEPKTKLKFHLVQYLFMKNQKLFVMSSGSSDKDFASLRKLFDAVAGSIEVK